MDHQPFKDWIFARDDLSPDQSYSLQEHLQACETCRHLDSALSAVELTFHKVPYAVPAPGFTTRTLSYVAQHQAQQQKRKGWISIGLTVLIVVSLVILLGFQVWSLAQSPGPYLAQWMHRLVSLVAVYFRIQDIFTSFSTGITPYTFLGLFLFTGIASFMSVLWLATYRKLSMARRQI